MIILYSRLKLLVALNVFIFFGSINAGESGFNFYLKSLKDFFLNGTYHTGTTIEIDGKTETHNVVSGVIITTALITATVTIMLPIVDQLGGSMAIAIEDYLPNIGPIAEFKEQNKLNRERKKNEQIMDQYDYEQRVKNFKESTGITNLKDLAKK